jgi:hypothetical protein
MNLLMLAPLYDNKGQVRYFIGCQIDVSSLIEGGRGLESFATLLARDRSEERFGDSLDQDPKRILGDFGAMLNGEESTIIKSKSRPHSFSDEGLRSPLRSGTAMSGSVRAPRRRLGMDDEPSSDRHLWPHPSLGHSGRLPGVYQNVSDRSAHVPNPKTTPANNPTSQYLLVRPYPSLRITFTSPALRIPGLLQTKFLERIGGPENVREGLLDSLAHGTGVTAKITWLSSIQGNVEGKPRWIHCTPLLGSDEKVGVWMVVMVDKEEITGQLHRAAPSQDISGYPMSRPGSVLMASPSQRGAASPRFTGNKLYAEYLRREGRPGTSDSETERREVDHQFRDF